MTTYAEKLLPHDVEAEEAVLGSILIDGECLTRLVPLLKEGAFYRERNQLCFDAALSLFQRDQAVDQVTLAGELARTEKLVLAGGMAYLSHLVSITPTSVHAEDYAQVISRTSSMRRLIDAGNRIIDLGYADTEDIEATMRQAEDALFTVRGTGQPRSFVPLKEIYDQYLQEQASAAADPEFSGMPIMSGFPDPGRVPGRAAAGRPGHPGRPSLHGKEQPGRQHGGQRREVRPDLRRLQPGDDQGATGHADPGLGGRDRLPPPQAGPVHPPGRGQDHRLHRPAVRSPGVHRRHPVPGHDRDAGQGQEAGPGAGAGPAGGRLSAAGAGEAEMGTVQPGAGDHRDLPGAEGPGRRSQSGPGRLFRS